jgi:hypothetical protein
MEEIRTLKVDFETCCLEFEERISTCSFVALDPDGHGKDVERREIDNRARAYRRGKFPESGLMRRFFEAVKYERLKRRDPCRE